MVFFPASFTYGGESAPNHPMYGKVPTHARTVNVYSIDNVFSFGSDLSPAKAGER
jgi:hypothetical protein